MELSNIETFKDFQKLYLVHGTNIRMRVYRINITGIFFQNDVCQIWCLFPEVILYHRHIRKIGWPPANTACPSCSGQLLEQKFKLSCCFRWDNIHNNASYNFSHTLMCCLRVTRCSTNCTFLFTSWDKHSRESLANKH